jgi:hypothetical protein
MLGAAGMVISGWQAPAHLLPSLVVADLKIFSAGTAHIGLRYAGKLPRRRALSFRRGGPGTATVAMPHMRALPHERSASLSRPATSSGRLSEQNHEFGESQ